MQCKQRRPKEVIWAYWREVLALEEDAPLADPIYIGDRVTRSLWWVVVPLLGIVGVFGLNWMESLWR